MSFQQQPTRDNLSEVKLVNENIQRNDRLAKEFFYNDERVKK